MGFEVPRVERKMHVLPSGTPALGPRGHRTYQPHRGIALRSRADALATPEWLKIKKGFEAHSIYSIGTFAISPDEIVTPSGLNGVAPVPVVSRARARYRRE
jgi:hypothetical protein